MVKERKLIFLKSLLCDKRNLFPFIHQPQNVVLFVHFHTTDRKLKLDTACKHAVLTYKI